MKKQNLKSFSGLRLKTPKTLGAFFLLTLLLAFNYSFAEVKTYEYPHNMKGYSMKQVPGASKYFAAGTYHHTAPNGAFNVGYHFMHMDFDGTVWTSKTFRPNTSDIEYRVVDVVPLNLGGPVYECWVILQVRDMTNPALGAVDYIHAEKLDASGNKLLEFDIKNAGIKGNYATSATELDGEIFITGFVTTAIPGSYPAPTNLPSNSSLGKYGAVFKYDNMGMITRKHWEVPDGGFFDYDMGLKIKASPGNGGLIPPSLLITGAANADKNKNDKASGALIMRVDPSLNSFKSNILYLPAGKQYPNLADRGIYGIDVVERSGNVWILYNFFDYNTVRRWGVIRVNSDINNPSNDLQVNPMYNSYVRVTTNNDDIQWAKQIIADPVHMNNYYIIGEAIGEYTLTPPCQSTHVGMVASPTNVNPFTTQMLLDLQGTGLVASIQSTVIQESNVGTIGNLGIDYLNPTTNAVGSNLEDVTRHNSFGLLANWSPATGIKMLSPMTSTNTSGAQPLNAKFLDLNSQGAETTCGIEYNECVPNIFYNNIIPYNVIYSLGILQEEVLPPTTLIDDPAPLTTYNCSAALYKPAPTGLTSIKEEMGVSIFPNPATSELNIKISNAQGKDFKFTLTDVTGKKVISKEQKLENVTTNIKLPKLSSGVYIGIVELDNEQYTEKIIIE